MQAGAEAPAFFLFCARASDGLFSLWRPDVETNLTSFVVFSTLGIGRGQE